MGLKYRLIFKYKHPTISNKNTLTSKTPTHLSGFKSNYVGLKLLIDDQDEKLIELSLGSGKYLQANRWDIVAF